MRYSVFGEENPLFFNAACDRNFAAPAGEEMDAPGNGIPLQIAVQNYLSRLMHLY